MLMRFAAVVALAISPAALAQEITLFQYENFGGASYSATNSISNLGDTGFNDRAVSARIRGGSWQLCSDAYYRGQCVTLQPGNYGNLRALGLANAVSSLREIGWSGGGGGGGGGIAGGGGGAGMGGGAIILYDAPGFGGRSVSLSGPVNNFDDIRFNDRAASAVVTRGLWQLCADADFNSTCEAFPPGRYELLGAVTGQVSSARPIDGGSSGGGNNAGSAWGNGRPGNPRIVMYEGPNFSGRAYIVSTDVLANLGNSGFNDRASSLRIEQGYWLFCTDANFGGQCRTLGPGDYPTLPYGLSNTISSARKISNDYPYNQAPRW